jgi:hypothetical protein
MSYLVAAPEFLASAATDLSSIGSGLSAAKAAAVTSTTGTLDVYADLFDDDLDAVADRLNTAIAPI